jgi:metallo-beta-lactamase class B
MRAPFFFAIIAGPRINAIEKRRHMKTLATLLLAACGSLAMPAMADNWSAPKQPFHIYGNTYYVGTGGISAILITSDEGHILIDSGTVDGAKVVAANIGTLGFKLQDIKVILNSHAHDDHAGGLASLQKLTGANVLAGAGNVAALTTGKAAVDDPQYGSLSPIAPVANLSAVADKEVVRQGQLAVTAHATPGHTAGGTSWTWQSCEAGLCKIMVFGDSLTAFSADGYQFSAHPALVAALQHSIAKVEALPCDILITAHPEVNQLFERAERARTEGASAYVDVKACRTLAGKARTMLTDRLAKETKAP